MEAETSGAQPVCVPSWKEGIFWWINTFDPGEIEEKGVLASRPQHGLHSRNDSELIPSRRFPELRTSSFPRLRSC